MAGCEAKCFRPLPNEELALLARLAGLFFAVTALRPVAATPLPLPPSGDAADKLAACFAWACLSTDPSEQRYFDACARWWSMLSPQNQDVVRTIIDVMASPHKDAAEGMAAGLPEAPKRPLP